MATANILLLGEIEKAQESGKPDFCNVLRGFVEDENIDLINIKITSVGGSVNKGMEVIELIDEARERGKQVNSYINLAYSMSACIALYCDKVFMNDFGILMLHPPFPEDAKAYEDPEFVKTLDLYKAMLTKVASVKRNIDMKVVDGLMNKESYLGSDEAFKIGLVDEIVSSKNIKNSVEYKLFAKEKDRWEIVNKQKPINKMDKLLKILNCVDEEQATQKIADIKNSALEAQEKVKTIENENSELKNKLESINNEKATDLIENAVKNGVIEVGNKADWVNLAKVNFDLAKKTIEAIKVPEIQQVSLAEIVNGTKATVKTGIDLETISYDDLEKNHPEFLAKMDIETVKQIIDRSIK